MGFEERTKDRLIEWTKDRLEEVQSLSTRSAEWTEWDDEKLMAAIKAGTKDEHLASALQMGGMLNELMARHGEGKTFREYFDEHHQEIGTSYNNATRKMNLESSQELS